MIEPPLTELMKLVDDRYTLVVASAKRARQLVDRQAQLPPEQQNLALKPVLQAVEEIYDGDVSIVAAPWEPER